MADLSISSQLDHNLSQEVFSTIRLDKVYPQNGVNTFTPNATSTTQVSFLFNNGWTNLAKCCISWGLLTPAPGVATNYTVLKANALFYLDRVQLQTRSGTVLADLTAVGNLGAVAVAPSTKLQDYLSCGAGGLESLSGSAVTGSATVLQTTTLLASTAVPITSVIQPGMGSAVWAAGVAGSPRFSIPNNAGAAITNNGNSDVLEPRYLFTSGANAAGAIFYSIPLGEIPCSIFRCNRTLPLSDVQLNIWFAGYDKYAMVIDIGTATSLAGVTLPTAPAANSMTNIQMYQAVETNIQALSVLETELSGGIHLPFPFTTTYKQNINSTSVSITNPVNNGYGRSILRAVAGVFHNTETLGSSFSLTNDQRTGATQSIANYQWFVNGVGTTFNVVDTTVGEDWLYMKDQLKGSALQGIHSYRQNNFQLLDLCGYPMWDDQHDFKYNGVPIPQTQDIQVTIKYTLGGATSAQWYYMFIVTQKVAHFTKNNPIMVTN